MAIAASLSGGSVTGLFLQLGTSKITFYGYNLSATLTDPNFLGLGLFASYALSGQLSDNTSITGKALILQSSAPTFELINLDAVPEPSAVAFGLIAGLSLLGLAARRRRAV